MVNCWHSSLQSSSNTGMRMRRRIGWCGRPSSIYGPNRTVRRYLCPAILLFMLSEYNRTHLHYLLKHCIQYIAASFCLVRQFSFYTTQEVPASEARTTHTANIPQFLCYWYCPTYLQEPPFLVVLFVLIAVVLSKSPILISTE